MVLAGLCVCLCVCVCVGGGGGGGGVVGSSTDENGNYYKCVVNFECLKSNIIIIFNYLNYLFLKSCRFHSI